MLAWLTACLRSRRSAIALTFALSAWPLTALVALSIDYAFYCQARSQFTLAADAAATVAVREANAAYTNYIDSNSPVTSTVLTTAQNDGISEGEKAGCYWFVTQLATLPGPSYIAALSGTKTNFVNSANCQAPAASGQTPSVNVTATIGSFSATVTYTGFYPPFFDPLFSSTNKWTISGTSGAAMNGDYEEFLVLMDTSGSMLIGADQSDITDLDNYSVCIPTVDLVNSGQTLTWSPPSSPVGFNLEDLTKNPPAYYGGDYRDWVNFNSVQHYKPGANDPTLDPTTTPTSPPSNTNPQGSCRSNNYNNASGQILAPCAFACHTTNNTSTATGTTEDLYGLARSNYLYHQWPTLRIDVEFNAVETLISTLQTDAAQTGQNAGQFTVGVYQFNDDVSSIVTGNTSGQNPDANQEATGNLSTAFTTVRGDDWILTPTETTIPPLAVDQSGNQTTDFTDFPKSITDLRSGTLANATLPALTPGGNGTSPRAPQKYLFIITDGLNDTSRASASGRLMGGITGICAEITGTCTRAGQTTTGVCYYLKNTLKFTIYILAISYYPIPVDTYYYSPYASPSNAYMAQDFPNLVQSSGGTIENWTDGDNTGNSFNTATLNISPTPVLQAINACASTNPVTGLPDVISATSSADIKDAMAKILQSALSASVHTTQ